MSSVCCCLFSTWAYVSVVFLLVAFVYVLSDFVALSRCCCVWPVAVCASFVFIFTIIEGTTFPTPHTFVVVGTVGFCVS